MSILLFVAVFATQVPEAAVAIRPVDRAADSRDAIPISEVAEPLALAIAGFDASADGRTSRAELTAALTRTFAAADGNGDGSLGYIEYSAWAQTWLGSQSALPGPFAIDADGDDRLSSAEFTAEFARQFARLDRDSDGAISRAELLTVRNPRLPIARDRDLRRIERERERQPR